MSVIVGVHGWDVLISTADACRVQLLRDVNDSVCIAVGYTLHSFCQLERLLLSLCTGIVSCHVSQPDTATLNFPADNLASSSLSPSSTSAAAATEVSSPSLDSATVSSSSLPQMSAMSLSDDRPVGLSAPDIDHQSTTSSQVSTDCEAVNTTESHQQMFTRSGRPVKSKKLPDFTSSDVIVRHCSSSCTEKTSLKQRRGHGRRQGQGEGRLCRSTINKRSCADVEDLDVVEMSVTDVVEASSNHQQTEEFCDQQTDDTPAADLASDITVEHGIASVS